MKHATDESVLGDFNDQTVTHKAQPFFAKGRFLGQHRRAGWPIQNYKISYAFAFEPLRKQYMVEFEDGRVQLIPFAGTLAPRTKAMRPLVSPLP
ncbi:hypothetical protein O9993_03865 [Vibrio lentus]|nr:hypothetical protein [Vibrio lentus]